ncbi:MAG TPA: S41 family peptidase [Blastocatellia bacterium]|nr:S41 family peptidase [Blastocatellia bacterium]
MSIHSKLTLVTLSAFIAIYSIVGGMLSKSNNPILRAIADPGPYPQLRIFEEVVRHIVGDYVEKPDLEKVRIGALRGLTDGLDPYSAYLLPPQVKEYQANKEKGDTTGMVIGQYSGFAYVIAVVSGSPADKAGIRVGDVIEYIDGHATRDLDLYDVKLLLMGAPGSGVELTLINRKTEKLKLVRGNVPPSPTEDRLLEAQIGYVKVPILSKGQGAAVESAVKEVIKKGAKSIILDLRGSAGGDLKEGLQVADFFLKSGVMAKTIGRKEKVLATYEAKPENDLTELPIAVIIDRTTAGASEVVAAAILENQRGEVVGERTLFGMGSEQELFPLDDGSALLLTTARYSAPSGKIFMTDGVTPSVEVKRTDLAEITSAGDGDDAKPPSQQRSPASPTAPGGNTPPVVVAPKPSDDLMLKKAVEVLSGGAKVKRKAA